MSSVNYELLSQPQAAARLGWHAATLRAVIKDGFGPPVTLLRRQVRIRSDLLTAWVEQHTAAAPAEAAAFDSAGEANTAAKISLENALPGSPPNGQ